MRKLAVVALGGNALLKGDQVGTIQEQEANVLHTCKHLLQLIKTDYDIVIGHGNGPQVGNVLLQHDAGHKVYGTPAMPMDICVAETQGSIGYMIEQQLHNVLKSENMEKDIITIVTQVLVDKTDPAFENPTKPVGPFYTNEEAQKLKDEKGWKFQQDPRGRGLRRVVPSPKPISISNSKSISSLSRDGQIVIAVGGGGIPVFYVEPNKLEGIEAVIDKDLALSLLANQIGAEVLFILTDVAKVYINFRKEGEKALDTITVSEANKYLAEGHFSEGSMAPKVRAAIQFIENGGKETIITEARMLGLANQGTKIIAG
jgi:carbamate kinase